MISQVKVEMQINKCHRFAYRHCTEGLTHWDEWQIYVCTESYRPTKEPQYLELHKGVILNHQRTGKRKRKCVHSPKHPLNRFQRVDWCLENWPWDENIGNVVVPWVSQVGGQIFKRTCSRVCNCLYHEPNKSQKSQTTCSNHIDKPFQPKYTHYYYYYSTHQFPEKQGRSNNNKQPHLETE